MSDEFKDNLNEAGTSEDENNTGVNFIMSDPAPEAEKKEETREEAPKEEAPKEEAPRETPTPENPVYARSYRQEDKSNYRSYQFTSQVPPEKTDRERNGSSHRKSSLGKKLGTAAATAAVFGLVAGVVFQATNFVGGKINPQTQEPVQVEKTQTTDNAASGESGSALNTSATSENGGATVSQVAKNAMPSVVSIVGVSVQEIPDIYKYYFGFNQEAQETKSSGSGIIVGQNDTELLIATNNHVVSTADSLTVCFTNQNGDAVTSSEDLEKTSSSGESGDQGLSAEEVSGSAVAAQVKGTDADNDLAVIAVKLADIPKDILEEIKIATIGDSNSLQMGDQVVAIGNALGYGQSVTSGYVSAMNRKVSSDNADSTFIQTDAAINPGNSGGALLNMKGELVGINSAKIASNEVEGVGFAIPISRAEPILDNMMNQETRYKVDDEDKAAYIGVTCLDVTEEAIRLYGMPQGVFVNSLEENGPAAQAGLQKGDVILKIDGTSVSTKEELVGRLEYYEAGEKIDFVISRAESGEYKEQTVTITLGAKKDAQSSQQNQKESER